ncbi:MAG: FGGY-family carbohydrate kinase [Eubacteriales bacterium]|nr:FGGY-family carbohydrate kinase [Eubacteriales bacterium]
MSINYKNTVLGIEFGSTRIKATLIDTEHKPIASGGYEWENSFVNGVWTYDLADAVKGLRECYADLVKNLGEAPETFGAIGISGMMHGYLPFDSDWNQIAEFRTWRNTITGEAAEKLTEKFGFNIPQRWSIAHVYQAILNGEEHIKKLAHVTTLAGYIHYLCTGVNAVGMNEGSGMFPVDSASLTYNREMLEKFDSISGLDVKAADFLPELLTAGKSAGVLTAEGAKLFDPTGTLKPGVPMAPPEGDAGTGMVATNSVRVRTGNVSAGTSDFSMLVLDHELGVHREIDVFNTPAGLPVAMVHCNNCTSDINAWVNLFGEFAQLIGAPVSKGELFTKLFNKALEGDADCGDLLSYNYFSGEGVTDIDEGRLIFARKPDSAFTLANFMRTHLVSALATLKLGMDILSKVENVPCDKMTGHGGYFKTPGVGQRILSAAINAPVTVTETAGEGGPYGMALLAAFMLWKDEGETLEDYLDNKVFAGAKSSTVMASEEEVKGFAAFAESYKNAFEIERLATKLF